MSASRLAVFTAAAFFTTGLSVDPIAIAPDHAARARPVITLDRTAAAEVPGAIEARAARRRSCSAERSMATSVFLPCGGLLRRPFAARSV